MIKVDGISKRFGSTQAVDHASFEVTRGEVVGFLGPNGAGKSTTMRILTCYLPPDEGNAEIAGFDTMEQSLEVRRRVGYLPENAPSYQDMEITEFLAYIASIRGIARDQITARIREMVEVCGLSQELGKNIGQLSRGYRQRVGLAQAMIHDPEILILDEPTSGLDPSQIIEIRELIREIGKRKTVMLSTHILPEVTATCNRVLIINHGRIIADGTPDELSRSSEGKETLTVSIRAGSGAVADAVDGLPMVDRVVVLESPGEGVQRLRVHAHSMSGISTGEEIFRLAVEKGWTLSELFSEALSLEDVFLQLTTQERE